MVGGGPGATGAVGVVGTSRGADGAGWRDTGGGTNQMVSAAAGACFPSAGPGIVRATAPAMRTACSSALASVLLTGCVRGARDSSRTFSMASSLERMTMQRLTGEDTTVTL